MRILGFSKKWDKLKQLEFTTFRYPRCDIDWYVGEEVQIVVQPRRKGGGDKLGIAKIINKEIRELESYFAERGYGSLVTDDEVLADGFTSREDMVTWMEKTYGLNYISRMNKLTLRWVSIP